VHGARAAACAFDFYTNSFDSGALIRSCCHAWVRYTRLRIWRYCGVALVSRIDIIIGLFCKRAPQKRRYSAKETNHFIDPTDRSHPISLSTINRWLISTSLTRATHVPAAHRSTLQHTATHCNTPQHTTEECNNCDVDRLRV